MANAFKFTERGTVHVQIGVVADGWDRETESLALAPSVLAFAISDTGVGIEFAHQNRIFEAFAQGDGTTARIYGGTGLGLSISRELVALLGGEITVTSTANLGSTFTVFLPTGATVSVPDVEPDAVPDAVPDYGKFVSDRRQAPLEVSAIEGTRILLVDDDFRNIFALSALLERGHADVIVAESGAEAIAKLQELANIDVVLLDIMMPVMDGYETMAAIRALAQFKFLPIIAVTGKVVAGERQRCIAAGANDYVAKPVDTRELLAALRPWLPARSVAST